LVIHLEKPLLLMRFQLNKAIKSQLKLIKKMETKIINNLINAFEAKLDILNVFMNMGASTDEIENLQNTIKQKLPGSYIQLLKKYNGEKRILGFMAGFGYSSIEDVIRDWAFFKNAPETQPAGINQLKKIKNTLYSPKRIPFAHDGSGNFICIDYDPNFDGISGQILYLPAGDPEPISVIADNFDNFLTLIIEKIESEELELIDEREDWDEEDWDKAEINFCKTWKDDWTDIAEEYNSKL